MQENFKDSDQSVQKNQAESTSVEKPKIMREIEIPRTIKFGEKIKHLRGNEKQETFAEKLGIKQSYLSKIEQGKVIPPSNTIRAFAKKLGMEYTKLLEGTSEKPEPEIYTDQIAICLNDGCAISPDENFKREDEEQYYDQRGDWYYVKLLDADGFTNNYCKKCGRELLNCCPECKKPIKSITECFCSHCGMFLIPPPPVFECFDEEIDEPGGNTISWDYKTVLYPRSIYDEILEILSKMIFNKSVKNLSENELNKLIESKRYIQFKNWFNKFESDNT